MNRVRPLADIITVILIAALLTSGCASSALWEQKEYHAADHPRLSLAMDSRNQEVLVQYDEQYEESKKLRRRAYWLSDYEIGRGGQGTPVFVQAQDYSGLIPIPLLDEAQASNAPAVKGYVAVPTPWQQGFDLWRDGDALGRFYLPTYFARPPRTFGRVIATPFAALGDTVAVIVVSAAVVGLVVALLYVESRSDWHDP